MRRPIVTFAGVALTAALLVLTAVPATALPAGSLDPTFGLGGITVANFHDGYPTCTWDHSFPTCQGAEEDVSEVIPLADGSVVARIAAGGTLVVKFRPDGRLDTTFGHGGRTSIVGSAVGELGIDHGGSIYVPWRPSPGTAPGSNAITKLLPSGEIDTSYGLAGTVLHDENERVKVVPSGQVYLYRTGVEANNDRSLRVSLLSIAGTPDPSYGDDGTATLLVPASAPDGWIVEPDPVVALGPGQEIVVLHRAYTSFGFFQLSRVVLGRLDPYGVPDLTFSPTGGVRFPAGPGWFPSLFQFNAKHLAVLPDGRILVAGVRPMPDGSAVSVVRLDAAGNLDPTFAFGGISIVELTTAPASSGQSYEALRWFGTDAAGRAIVVGDSGQPSTSGERHHVVRLAPNGFLDASFGIGGTTTLPTEIARGGTSFGTAPTGAVLIGGQARSTDRLCGPTTNRVPCADSLLLKLRG